jgi:hypothetical protein
MFMSRMTEQDNAEFDRIAVKMFYRYLTEDEQAFYDKWRSVRWTLATQHFVQQQQELQVVLTKRQKANAKRREAKHGSVEPRHYQRWFVFPMPIGGGEWQKLRLAWTEKPETLGFVQELICINCESDLFGQCAACSIASVSQAYLKG